MNLYTRWDRPKGLPWDLLVDYRLDDQNDEISEGVTQTGALVFDYLGRCDAFLKLMSKAALYNVGGLPQEDYGCYVFHVEDGDTNDMILEFTETDGVGTLSLAGKEEDLSQLFVKDGSDSLSSVTMLKYNANVGKKLHIDFRRKTYDVNGVITDKVDNSVNVNDMVIMCALRNVTSTVPESLRRKVFIKKKSGSMTSIVGMVARQSLCADFSGVRFATSTDGERSVCFLEPGKRVVLPLILMDANPGNIYAAFECTQVKWVSLGSLEGAISLSRFDDTTKLQKFVEPKSEFLFLKEEINDTAVYPITLESWI